MTLSLKNNKKGPVFKRVTLFVYALIADLFLKLEELRVRSVIRVVHQGINPYTDLTSINIFLRRAWVSSSISSSPVSMNPRMRLLGSPNT